MMSVQEHLFLRTGLRAEEAARRLAQALAMTLTRDVQDRVHVSRPVGGGQVGGEVYANDLADPTEGSLLDVHDTIWDIGYTGRDRDVQMGQARALFLKCVRA